MQVTQIKVYLNFDEAPSLFLGVLFVKNNKKKYKLFALYTWFYPYK